MDDLDKANGIVKFFEDKWFEKVGLVASILTVTIIEVSLLFKCNSPWWVALTIILITIAFIFVSWWLCQQPPKTPKEKIGFLVSIASSNDTEGEKLREDFIIPLRQLVKSGKAGKAFHFIELPRRLAKKIIDPDDAQRLRVQTRSQFVLYGRIRLRNNLHYLELSGIVAHKPIPDHVKDMLAQEFGELLPRKVQISMENDLLSFEFTSEWAGIVARYIIGIATGLSGDLVYAETLFSDALERLQSKNTEFPIYNKLAKRIPTRISELYEAKARSAHLRWVETQNPAHLERLGEMLEQIKNERRNQPMILNLQAIHAFAKNRDVEGAITLLKRASDSPCAVWHYNMAFLHGYKGDLKAAIRQYRKGMSFQVEADALSQIEDFICGVLHQEPERYWLQYCLGFFNWQIKGDSKQAAQDFRSFLDSGNENDFEAERNLTNKWLKDKINPLRAKSA